MSDAREGERGTAGTASPRLRVLRRPRLDEAMYVAQGHAMVLVLKTLILVMDDAGTADAQEIADLLLA